MNYIKIHKEFIEYFVKTGVRDRIKKRDVKDKRLSEESIYIEIHHIIPRSLGGLDHPDNLVSLLPEEHIFIHMLRYKAFGHREDILAVRFMLNGIGGRRLSESSRVKLSKKIRAGYSFVRSNASKVRKTHGWQTLDGLRRISEARKGKIIVRDSNTRERIPGCVSVYHPNVINGTWVHHSKGRKQSVDEIEYKRNLYKGQNNPNASGLSDEYFIEKSIELSREYGFILSWRNIETLSYKRGFRWIRSLRSRFSGRGISGYIDIMEKRTGLKYKKNVIRIKK